MTSDDVSSRINSGAFFVVRATTIPIPRSFFAARVWIHARILAINYWLVHFVMGKARCPSRPPPTPSAPLLAHSNAPPISSTHARSSPRSEMTHADPPMHAVVACVDDPALSSRRSLGRLRPVVQAQQLCPSAWRRRGPKACTGAAPTCGGCGREGG